MQLNIVSIALKDNDVYKYDIIDLFSSLDNIKNIFKNRKIHESEDDDAKHFIYENRNGVKSMDVYFTSEDISGDFLIDCLSFIKGNISLFIIPDHDWNVCEQWTKTNRMQNTGAVCYSLTASVDVRIHQKRHKKWPRIVEEYFSEWVNLEEVY